MYSKSQINDVLQCILSELNLNDEHIRKFTSHDNHVYKVGNFIIKIASAEKYNAAMYKYYDLYYYLKQLSFEVPEIIKIGSINGINYSVLSYIDDDVWNTKDDIVNDLCGFYRELYSIDIDNDIIDNYGDNSMNFHRGDHISVYRDSFYNMLDKYNKVLNVNVLRDLFDEGLKAKVVKRTFVHGDLMPNNMLLKNGKIHSIIDFGTMGIGDLSCDLMIIWFYMNKIQMDYIKTNLLDIIDEDMWLESRSWAIWKALANGDLRLLLNIMSLI